MSKFLKLKTRLYTPRGGWRFKVEQTGKMFVGGDFDSLVCMVRTHMKANAIDVPLNLAEIVEDQICRNTLATFVKFDNPQKVQATKRTTTIGEKISQLQRVWEETGRLLVSRKVAEERSQICKSCPHNRPLACLTCNGVYDWLCTKFMIPKLPEDMWLHVCDIGPVYNKAQVHLSDEVFARLVPQRSVEMFPSNCWKRKLLDARYGKKGDNAKEE